MSTNEMEGPVEQRTTVRTSALLKGRIETLDSHQVFDCTVRELSDKGARLIVENAPEIPADFRLHIPLKGWTKSVTVRWREQQAIGVEFQKDDNVEMMEARLRKLEREVRGLIADMASLKGFS